MKAIPIEPLIGGLRLSSHIFYLIEKEATIEPLIGGLRHTIAKLLPAWRINSGLLLNPLLGD